MNSSYQCVADPFNFDTDPDPDPTSNRKEKKLSNMINFL